MKQCSALQAKIVKVLTVLVVSLLVLVNGSAALADGWTAEKASEFIPPLGATGYWVHGQWVSCLVAEEQQDALISSVAIETGVDKVALKKAVGKRNVLYKQGKIAWFSPDGTGLPADVVVLAQGTGSSSKGSGSSSNSGSGSGAGAGAGVGAGAAAGGAAGAAAGSQGNAEDANPGTSFEIRQNYFKRFPYAKSAYSADVKQKVSDNESSKGTGGSDARKGAVGILGGGKGKKKQKGPLNLQKSVGPGVGVVMAYRYVVKFCDDNPKKGICYFQPLLIAKDNPATKRDEELFRTAMQGVNGLPLTDTQFQILDRENKQRFLELLFDPERFMWLAVNTGQMQGASLSNSFAGAGQSTFNNAFLRIVGGTENLGANAQTSSDAGGPLGALLSKNGPLGSIMGTSGGAGKGGGSAGNGGGGGFGGSFSGTRSDVLLNVANENAAVAVTPGTRYKSVQQAVWMVQQAYKFIFMPMAILFLLPGAVLTQVKGYVSKGILGAGDHDASSPFEGILRAMIAIFLIPATQLIISYAVDVGNSMAESVKPWISKSVMDEYVYHQLYDVPVGNVTNALLGPGSGQTTVEGKTLSKGGTLPGSSSGTGAFPGGGGGGAGGGDSEFGGFLSLVSGFFPEVGGFFEQIQQAFADIDSFVREFGNSIFGLEGQGKGAEIPPNRTIQEKQLWLSQIMQLMFNGLNYIMSYALIVLCAYQLVMMCYLLLLGPISACFFAWPGVGRSLFRSVFSQWLNAVIVLSLWRFYWCVILAVMTQRIIWIMETGGFKQDIQWEMMVFCCFLGMMLVIPFQPFNFDPGGLASQVIEKGAKAGGDIGKAAGEVTKGTPLEGVGKDLQANMGQVSQQMSHVAQGVSREGGTGLLGDPSGLISGKEPEKYEQGRRQALQPLPPSSSQPAGVSAGAAAGVGASAMPTSGAPPAAPSPPSSASASSPTVSAIQRQVGAGVVQTLPSGHPPNGHLSAPGGAGAAVSAGVAVGGAAAAGAGAGGGGYRLVVANASVSPNVGVASAQAMGQFAQSRGLTPAGGVPPAPPAGGGSPPTSGGPPAPSGPAPSGPSGSPPPSGSSPSSPGAGSGGGSPGVGPPPSSRPS